MDKKKAKYNRVLLKLSGEFLAGEKGSGINLETVNEIVDNVIKLHDLGVEVAVVVGGGNFWRGAQNSDVERSTSDQIGMLATCMNALYFSDVIRAHGQASKVLSAVGIEHVLEAFNQKKALKYLEEDNILVFAAGTGHPYFSTDSGAALRAAEIHADIIFKGTNVDGVYDKDPNKYDDAKLIKDLSHEDILKNGLNVMDMTAAALCKDNNIPIAVFNLKEPENMLSLACGDLDKATFVHS